jgi:(p)ppGpp synthase/HD superfamily hydrolase
MDIYEQALKVAVEAHAGQVRKHDSSPYVVHPIMVARIIEQAGFGEVIIAAGLVHDVLEDTTFDEVTLRKVLGDDVVNIVTAVSEDTSLPWEERKELYVNTVVSKGEAVWAVSVADKIHNARDLIGYHTQVGKKAWEVFNRGKSKKLWFENLLFQELKLVWQHSLLDEYADLLTQLEALPD